MHSPMIAKTSSIPRIAADLDVHTARPLGSLKLSVEEPMENA